MSTGMSVAGRFTQAQLRTTQARILDFWFKETKAWQWFQASSEFDARVRQGFAGDVELARAGAYDELHDMSAQGSLALVIALDQFPRNIFRGSAAAFASDAKTGALVRDGIARGYDQALLAAAAAKDKDNDADNAAANNNNNNTTARDHLVFYFVPLMHGEDLASQDLCVAKAKEFGLGEDMLKAAEQHRDIIARFGRFPYRNHALRRATTPREAAFLNSDDNPFRTNQ